MDEVFFHTDEVTGLKRKLKLVAPNENTKVPILQEYYTDDSGIGKWIKIDLNTMLKEKWNKTVFQRQLLIEKKCKEPVEK